MHKPSMRCFVKKQLTMLCTELKTGRDASFKFMILLYVKMQDDPPCTRETCSATASAVARIIVEVMNAVGEDHEDVAIHHLPALGSQLVTTEYGHNGRTAQLQMN